MEEKTSRKYSSAIWKIFHTFPVLFSDSEGRVRIAQKRKENDPGHFSSHVSSPYFSSVNKQTFLSFPLEEIEFRR